MILEIVVITLGSFIASMVNSMFATGGVYLLIIASSSVLPLTAAVPLQSAFTFSSLMTRVALFWAHLNWPIIIAFVAGAAIGVGVGAQVFVSLDEAEISILLGSILLTVTWFPRIKRRLPIKHPFFAVGVVHSFLGTLFGVGAFLQPALIRSTLLKASVTGTLAACLLCLDTFKLVGYVLIGFDYIQYVYHIIFATLAGFLGAWLGKRFSGYVSETLFRKVFLTLVTIVGVKMLLQGIYTLWLI